MRTRLLALITLGLSFLHSGGEPTKEPPTLRVAAYNIKHGRGMDGKVDLERTAAVLRGLDSDLVALQEVDKICQRSGKVDQAKELGRLLQMKHRFGMFMEFQGGEYGLAVLSRHPIVRHERHVLAPGAEPRCALEVVVEPEGFSGPLSFVSIHHDWTKEELRVAQVRDLIKALADRTHPVILAGDFNARPGAESLKLLEQAGFRFLDKKGAKTFPSEKPRIEIDYLATRGLDLEPSTICHVHEEKLASDHRPIHAELPAPTPKSR